jgi:hypothetical protein
MLKANNSSIDFYLYDRAQYPYYLITGLENDKAMQLMVNMFPHPASNDYLGN